MKRTVMAAMVLSLLTGSVALAAPQDYHHDRDQRHDQRQEQRRDEHHRGHEMRGHERREHEMREREMREREMRERGEFNRGRYERPRGWYSHRWRRGDRLPLGFRGPAYVIPDYAYYRLPPPPPGYYWVRVDDNAVLAVVATGLVANVVYNVFR